jgi:hypothetical protein
MAQKLKVYLKTVSFRTLKNYPGEISVEVSASMIFSSSKTSGFVQTGSLTN